MTGDQIRVLHLVQNLNYGGMERLLVNLAHGSDSTRFEMHVLVLQYVGRFGRDLEGAATVHLVRPLRGLSMLWPAAVIRKIREVAPDVVHTHSGVWYKGSRAARMAGVPRVVHTEHGRPYPYGRLSGVMDKLAARNTDVAVAVSAELGQQMEEDVGRFARIGIIPNGVDVGRFGERVRAGCLRAELGIGAGTTVIGSVGRLEPVKGYDVLIRAFAEIDTADRPVLILVGDGSERESLRRLAGRLGVEDRVRLLGWRDDVPELLPDFDIFAMGSRSEGTSVSLLEAMAACVCPVVTSVGGNPTVLGPDLVHRLAAPEDPRSLAQALRAAVTDACARQRDAALGRERAATYFSLESMVAGYQALYAAGL